MPILIPDSKANEVMWLQHNELHIDKRESKVQQISFHAFISMKQYWIWYIPLGMVIKSNRSTKPVCYQAMEKS